MRHVVSAAFGLCLAAAGMAGAQVTSGPAVVVELYTSQGCSSCPPADEFFAALTADPAVIPLALHVDYWDYIGWADRFADPAFTERQKSYARAAGSRMIYTPQVIVGGTDQVKGNQPTEVKAAIRRHLDLARDVTISLQRNGPVIVIRAEAGTAFDWPARVQLVRYRPIETVTIERGENAGRTLSYHNIVTSWQVLADWTGDAPLTVEAAAPGSDPAVVIVQQSGPSLIIAAARID